MQFQLLWGKYLSRLFYDFLQVKVTKNFVEFCILLQMCINYKCQSFDSLDIGNCPVANNKECGGRGVS